MTIALDYRTYTSDFLKMIKVADIPWHNATDLRTYYNNSTLPVTYENFNSNDSPLMYIVTPCEFSISGVLFKDIGWSYSSLAFMENKTGGTDIASFNARYNSSSTGAISNAPMGLKNINYNINDSSTRLYTYPQLRSNAYYEYSLRAFLLGNFPLSGDSYSSVAVKANSRQMIVYIRTWQYSGGTQIYEQIIHVNKDTNKMNIYNTKNLSSFSNNAFALVTIDSGTDSSSSSVSGTPTGNILATPKSTVPANYSISIDLDSNHTKPSITSPVGTYSAPKRLPEGGLNIVYRFADSNEFDYATAIEIIIEKAESPFNIIYQNTISGLSPNSTNITPSVSAFSQYPKGTPFKVKIRLKDSYVFSPWSDYQFFILNNEPVSAPLTGSTSVGTPIAVGTKPTLSFEYSDLENHSLSKIRVRFKNVGTGVSYEEIIETTSNSFVPIKELERGAVIEWNVIAYDSITADDNYDKTTYSASPRYIVINDSPKPPIVVSPDINIRTGLRPQFLFILQGDYENDAQRLTLRIANDSGFVSGLREFKTFEDTNGWELFVNGEWMPIAADGYVPSDYVGYYVRYTMQSDLPPNSTIYYSISSNDSVANTNTPYWTDTRSIRVGNRIELSIKNPVTTVVNAKRISLNLFKKIGEDITREVISSHNPIVTRTGVWNKLNGLVYENTYAFSSKAKDATMMFDVKTDKVQIYAPKDSSFGKADVYVDGVKHGQIDLYSATRLENQIVYTINGLNKNVSHNIKLVVVGSANVYSSDVTVVINSFKCNRDKSTFKVEVCNNAFDVSPTWEDATQSVIDRNYYEFKNMNKTANSWGLNFKITIEANGSYEPIELDGYGFSYE